MAAQFQIVMRSGPNAGKVYPLELPDISIGRDTSNTIAINDAEISRKHAKLTLHGSAFVIQDLGSTNGTFVNGMRVTSTQVLNAGDTISFGETISLSYEMAYDTNATVVSSARAPQTVVPVPRAAAPVPIPAPAPTPAPMPAPVPAPVYSGQVPAGPLPLPAAPAKKNGGKVILLLVIVVVCLILACVATFVWVDADKTGVRWCMFPFKYIAQMLGATCP